MIELTTHPGLRQPPWGTCSSCGAEVRWGRTKANRFMILDLEPNPKGNCLLEGRIYMAHWATCPSADQHRKEA